MERIRLYSMFLACLVLAACAGEDPASDPATPATAALAHAGDRRVEPADAADAFQETRALVAGAGQAVLVDGRAAHDDGREGGGGNGTAGREAQSQCRER